MLLFKTKLNRELDRLIRSIYKDQKHNVPANDESLKLRIINTIPKNYGSKKAIFHKQLQWKIAFGLSLIVFFLFIGRLFLGNFVMGKDPFKPTKVIYLENPAFGEDSFQPTKTVIISENDRIN